MPKISKTVLSVGEKVEQLKLLHPAGEKVAWHKHFGKQLGSFLKDNHHNKKTHLLYDPVISLLAIYPREMKAFYIT